MMVRDPVCGMQIAEADAQAVRRAGDTSIYFCSAACARQFDADPQHYDPSLGGTSAIAQGQLLRPIGFGLLAIAGMLSLYLGVITLTLGGEHAFHQLADNSWFISAIALGVGMQVGLYTYLRGLHAHGGGVGVAVSSGTSTVAMMACCSHLVVNFLPIVGISGAAMFLSAYQTPLLWLGIAMNLASVVYLLRKVLAYRRTSCHTSIASGNVAS